MNATGFAALAAAATLALSLALPFAVRPLLVKLGIMDVPNERSSHDRPVLRGLGLAVLIAIAAGGALVWLVYAIGIVSPVQALAEPAQSGTAAFDSWPLLIVVVVGSFVAGLLGLSEDLKGLSVPVRSALLIAIAVGVAVAVLGLARTLVGDAAFALAPGIEWGAEAFWLRFVLGVYAVLFISSYINVANFMDGLNGISGLHGVVAGLAFAAAGLFGGLSWLTAVGLVLAAGFAGFLPWNLTKPGAFLGDVGSYLLGGAVAVTSFAAFAAGVPILATIGPMVIYFGDVGVTLVRRMRAGHKWDEPHKEHVYQRIQQLGYSHVAASDIAAGCTAAASLLGLMSFFTSWIGTLALTVAGLAVVVFYLSLPRLLPPRRTS